MKEVFGKSLKHKYETHLHTSPVSACAIAGVRETLEFYSGLGYDGVFITNHFLDGNINIDRSRSYEERIGFYFSDYENALELSTKINIKVFCGVELSYGGTDFLIYGLDKEWYLSHPEIMTMAKSEELRFMADNGALIIQAHPFREAGYIDHIRLYPRSVHGVEVINACRTEFENRMALHYAESYGLIMTAGSDNHRGAKQKTLAGLSFDRPITVVNDFIDQIKQGRQRIFTMERKGDAV